MLQHGPFAMAEGGETPNVAYKECEFFHREGYDWIFKQARPELQVTVPFLISATLLQ